MIEPNFTINSESERNLKTVNLNTQESIVPYEIFEHILSYVSLSNFSLKDVTVIPCVCQEWKEMALRIFPFPLIRLLQKKENHKTLGKIGSKIKHVTCWNSLVAYNLWSRYKSDIYLHDVWNNKQIFSETEKRFEHHFLHLNSDSFILSGKREPDLILLGGDRYYMGKCSIYSHDGFLLNENKQIEGDFVTYNPERDLFINCSKDVELLCHFSYSSHHFSEIKFQIFHTNGQVMSEIILQQDEWIKKSYEIHDFCIYNINSICFSGEHLVIGWAMGKYIDEVRRDKPYSLIHLYKMSNGELFSKSFQDEIRQIASNDQRIVVVCKGGDVLILDPQTLDRQESLHIKEIDEDIVEMQLYGDQLVCLLKSNQLIVVNLLKQSQFNLIPASVFAITKNYLFTGHSEQFLIEVWDLKTHKFIGSIETKDLVSKLDVKTSEEGICLVAGLENGQVQVWKDNLPKQEHMLFKITSHLKNIFN